MEMVRISVFLLLFLSQTWAGEEELEMVDMKQDVGRDNIKCNITVDLWAELKELRDMVIQQKTELSIKIEKLEEEKTESPKVAFSLGLTDAGVIGPFTTDITLKFSKVFTNFGRAYNTDTGIFTAPLRGVYYFRFTGFSMRHSTKWLGVNLYRNGERVNWNSDYDDEGYVTMSNGFVLELEKGDVVYLVLPSDHIVYDDSYNRTVFSGFLIFPL